MKLGRYAGEAVLLELKGQRLSWTNDHWTGPNDETYTTVTGHYISNDWQMQSACLDFKVFHGSTTGEKIYADIKSVLTKFKGETVLMMEDTIGITDTTGNMGVLGRFLRENGHEHAYCTDHNFHLNAKLAFDCKYFAWFFNKYANVFINFVLFLQQKMYQVLQKLCKS